MSQATVILEALQGLMPASLGQRLAARARLMTLRPRQIVIGHQDHSNDVYIVIEGSVRVELHSLNGREIILADLGPGEIFGELAALDDQPRTATVTATGKSLLACVPGESFRTEALADAESAGWLTRRLVKQIRLLDERNFELNALAVRSRLHCELLRLGLDAGLSDDRAVIAPAPTHAELASRIGTHREAVTRELQYLQSKGIIDKHGRELVINQVSQLAETVRAAAGDVDLVQRAELSRAG